MEKSNTTRKTVRALTSVFTLYPYDTNIEQRFDVYSGKKQPNNFDEILPEKAMLENILKKEYYSE